MKNYNKKEITIQRTCNFVLCLDFWFWFEFEFQIWQPVLIYISIEILKMMDACKIIIRY